MDRKMARKDSLTRVESHLESSPYICISSGRFEVQRMRSETVLGVAGVENPSATGVSGYHSNHNESSDNRLKVWNKIFGKVEAKTKEE
ncbi:hypothetical protein KQX54_019937 [Cotesia glomerata]|uniref:Uncharacterized protein n=1 Tax=Cotesia glomerata TaxID=32391 RepID=A0AAV7ICR9_COTGL|nr:hypothetical protein KQX54_019937 [Cotesia glomerata]